jgi:hypothetical protein
VLPLPSTWPFGAGLAEVLVDSTAEVDEGALMTCSNLKKQKNLTKVSIIELFPEMTGNWC